MKLLKAILFVILLMTVPVIIQSCCFDTCGPCIDVNDDGPPHYDFEGMTMTLYSRSNGQPLPAGTTRLSEIEFYVYLDLSFTSLMETGGSALFACSPAPEMANQQITSIVITSNNDMIAAPASIFKGENLAILFEVNTDNHGGPIDDILNKQFTGRRLNFHSEAVLDSQQVHTFTFVITLDNGAVFEMVTREVNLIAG